MIHALLLPSKRLWQAQLRESGSESAAVQRLLVTANRACCATNPLRDLLHQEMPTGPVAPKELPTGPVAPENLPQDLLRQGCWVLQYVTLST
jgi:hypothetical protein